MAAANDPRPVRISVRVLGPVGVAIDGSDVALPSRRQRALLAALAVRGRTVPVDDLLEAVWDDDPPDAARTTLQTYVSRLRCSIGRDAIEHDPAGYRLGSGLETDVGRLRDGIASLKQLRVDDHERRANLATELVGLWDGPALSEFGESDWFRGVRVELDEAWAALVDSAAGALIALGRAADAIALLEEGVGREPWREPTQILLVRALHAAGRTTDAVRSGASYRKRLGEETGLVPGREFDAAESEVLSGEAPVAAPPRSSMVDVAVPGRLPRATPLVGRRDELRSIGSAMVESRLVTVVGPGGVGKTRLVAELIDDIDRPCVVVELAPVSRGSVAAAVSAALGIRAERPTAELVAERIHGERLVLVLDNAEHVVAEVRGLCRTIVDRCTDVVIVVTSRERVGLADEVVSRLDPLPTEGAASDAARLFLDRVRRAGPRHDVESSDPSIEVLCARLDGVPLALELAASRAAVLGLADLERVLADSDVGLADVDDTRGRHGTLGNVVEWSVGLLDEPAQRLLAALSVLRGDFDLDAAVAVGSAIISEPVPVILGRLVDASLVRPGTTAGSYGMLDMVRSYAAQRLAELECDAQARRAHASWVGDRIEAVDAMLPGPDEGSIVAAIDAMRNDVRAAIRWALDADDVTSAARVASALAGPLLYRPDADLLHEILLVSGHPSLHGSGAEHAALAAGARAAFLLGDLDTVAELAERSVDVERPEPATRNRARHALGVLALYEGRFADAQQWFDAESEDPSASLAERLDALGGAALARCYSDDRIGALEAIEHLDGLLEAAPSPTYRAFGEYARGEVHLAAGDVDEAIELLSRAADRAWESGAQFVWGVASTALCSVLVRHRPPARARESLLTLVERWRRTATWPQLWTTLRLVAIHLAMTEHPGVARLILEAAERDPAAPTPTGSEAVDYVELCARLDAELGPVAAGAVAAAEVVDRSTVLDRALDALRTPLH